MAFGEVWGQGIGLQPIKGEILQIEELEDCASLPHFLQAVGCRLTARSYLVYSLYEYLGRRKAIK